MHDYLTAIFNKKNDIPYAGKSVIKVGDFMQLKPIGGAPIYPKQRSKKEQDHVDEISKLNRKESNNAYVELNPNRWAKHFKCFELSQCMRQRDDLDFAHMIHDCR